MGGPWIGLTFDLERHRGDFDFNLIDVRRSVAPRGFENSGGQMCVGYSRAREDGGIGSNWDLTLFIRSHLMMNCISYVTGAFEN
jgi:hypothetical protein